MFCGVEEVKEHLYRRSSISNYHHRTSHGDASINDFNHYDSFTTEGLEPYNTYQTMVIETNTSFNPKF